VDCQSIVDLTHPQTLAATGYSLLDLACGWEFIISNGDTPPTWNLVEQLISAEVAGIIVLSYAAGVSPGGKNIVFWNWNNSLPYRVKVIDDYERLPKDGVSWEGR